MLNQSIKVHEHVIKASSARYNAAMSERAGQTAYKKLSECVYSRLSNDTIPENVDTMNVCIDAGLEACGDIRFRGSLVQAACHLQDDPFAWERLTDWIRALRTGGLSS